MINSENYDFSQKLNRLIETCRTLRVRYRRIALYGYGVAGQIVAPLLGDSLINVVDQSKAGDKAGSLTIKSPSEVSEGQPDCVLISVLGREKEITGWLRTIGNWSGMIETFRLSSSPFAESTPLRPNQKLKLQSLKSRFRGERCFIVGNGPSLNQCDLSLLKDEYTFGVNGIFYKTREMGFRPTFYVVEDNHVVDDNLDDIIGYDCRYKFFPSQFEGQIPETENTFFFNYDRGFFMKSSTNFCRPRFSFEASEQVYAGQTVTYTNMQLAVFLGFTEIILIGVDFSYSLPKTTVVQGDTYISGEDDPNHFHPEYFGKGKKWHDPKLDRVLLNYQHAQDVLSKRHIRILNATKGGKLEVYPRISFEEAVMRRGCVNPA